MKEYGTIRLGITSAGCFLGAGYVSGQELWKFFGVFGGLGIVGRIISLCIQIVFMYILLWLGKNMENASLDRALVAPENSLLRSFAALFQLVFLFGVSTIMLAGAGALVEQLLSLPAALGGAVFAAVACIIAFGGIDGLSRICALLVPGLVLMAVIISVSVISAKGFNFEASPNLNASPLLHNWWVASLSYVSYNTFGSVGVLLSVGERLADKKTMLKGSLLGVLLLLLISLCMLPALGSSPEAAGTELPMLALAKDLHPAFGWIYAGLLLTGMMGTTVSFWVSITNFIVTKKPGLKNRRKELIVAMAIAAFAVSLLGFGGLIGTFYPMFGYIGFAAMAGLLYHFAVASGKKAARS